MAALDREILPDGVKPINYAISLFDIEYGGAFTYQGAVNITAKILKATKEITLNYKELNIQSAAVHVENAKTTYSFSQSEITYDVPKQRVTIKFAEEIPASETARILIKFEGTINNTMAGFYRSKYTPAVEPAASVPKDGDSHVMFSTQFESSDARLAFPCWDEPNIKATFDLDLEIPEDQVALSNMPEKSITKGKNGLKVVSFERTPIMSTYLLAWAIGDFEYVEEFTERKYNGKHLPVRVYTTKGLKEQGRYALEHAHKIIDYFSEIFKIDYPLPKSDLLAVHEFSHGAMENWGLVTYRTTAVLYDEGKTDPKFKNRVAYVVAHELAHQWFGNLVTMDWWSELWLNEGFATWVGWLAIEHFHPDWNVWPQFVAESMQSAFGLDALRSSHPIEVPVKDALDVAQIFDAISYLKGSSVIRMLAAHLGQEKFLNGVSNYLKAHAYGNATTTDLWSALSESSGHDVVALMDPWIRKIGYPVITVAEEPGQVTVRQSRYLSTGDVTKEDDEVTWWVPLSIKGKGTGSANDVVAFAIEKKEEVIRDINDDFYKLNADTTGFFRTNYPPARLAKLGKQVSQLSDLDKIGLVGDAGSLAFSGYATTPSLLSFLEGFTGEDNYLVWQQITTSLGNVQSVFSDDVEIADALKKFALKLIDEAVEKIGWKISPGEDYLTGQLRALLIKKAGLNGNAAVIKEAQRQFALFANELDTSVIDASLREAVFVIVVKYGSAQEYETLKRFYTTTTATDGKELCVRGLAKVQIPELLPNFLQFLFHEVVVQDVHFGAATFVANSKSRISLWAYIKEHFDEIKTKYGANIVVLARLLKSALGEFSDYETEKDIADFFKDKDNRGYDRGLANISDQIKGRAGYRERDGAITLEWLKANHYA